MTNLSEKIKINYSFRDINDTIKPDIYRWVEEKITKSLDSYFKKFLSKDGAEIIIEIKLEEYRGTTKPFYNGSFRFHLDKVEYFYKREKYENIEDLVQNAFNHLKEELADK